MKKLISLILAVTVLSAMCACAEKMNEISQSGARELLNGALKLEMFLSGSYNVGGGEIITESGIEYAPADDIAYSSWSDFEAAVKNVYTEKSADKILASQDCFEKDGMTYIRYIGSAGDEKPGYSVLSFGEISMSEKSDSGNAFGTCELVSGDKLTVEISYENTPDGWRISELSDIKDIRDIRDFGVSA